MQMVDFANLAITKLGGSSIKSLDEVSATALSIREQYELSIREVLEKHSFYSARKFKALVNITGMNDNPNFSNAFQFPLDCCRILSIKNYDVEVPYELGQNKIYSNFDNLSIEYTAYDQNLTGYSTTLIDACAFNLALRIAPRVVQSGDVMQMLTIQSNHAFKEACRLDKAKRKTTTKRYRWQ